MYFNLHVSAVAAAPRPKLPHPGDVMPILLSCLQLGRCKRSSSCRSYIRVSEAHENTEVKRRLFQTHLPGCRQNVAGVGARMQPDFQSAQVEHRTACTVAFISRSSQPDRTLLGMRLQHQLAPDATPHPGSRRLPSRAPSNQACREDSFRHLKCRLQRVCELHQQGADVLPRQPAAGGPAMHVAD